MFLGFSLGTQSPQLKSSKNLTTRTSISAPLMATTLRELDKKVLEARISDLFSMIWYVEHTGDSYGELNEMKVLLNMYFACRYHLGERVCDELFKMFNEVEFKGLLDASEKPKVICLRVNALKTSRQRLRRTLLEKGVLIEPLSWTQDGLAILIGSSHVHETPEYLNGHCMFQDTRSFLTVMTLDPKENEKIVDVDGLGEGATHIASLMNNRGSVQACAIVESKEKLKAACKLMGINIVKWYSGLQKLCDALEKDPADKVLLDAPCSCSRTNKITRNCDSVTAPSTFSDVKWYAKLQKGHILSVIDMVKPGGYIVYSTCSPMISENEAIINYALKMRDVEVVDTGLELGYPGLNEFRGQKFQASFQKMRRFYPSTHGIDVCFIAKLKKRSNSKPKSKQGRVLKRRIASTDDKKEIKIRKLS
ncbi:Bacterial Fmu (Sun)/eukaryotic nucleolar NOL1/Nop2p [Macleaya cordata]|uniref:Bacterial Fmu (Sun)/eukaryotic nucleolar NOL1/Nop2p n=1 Tax=Macleaya cordata TaxID=56857 RepID=A0A200QSN1_MACCD|nr:Bacterial Fmu (Sun)/eukaryotic nucleolar NOL1/Nop2p [Macleaya cordata]